ncbi:MAG TPA: FKBP-type peptidyl-prolyl cis-trans isomerase [Pseudomonas sp.]
MRCASGAIRRGPSDMLRFVLIAAAALSLAACQGQQKLPDQSAASRAFLEKTANEAGVQKLPSGVMYKVVREGPANGVRPQLSDEVKVHYEGKLVDGKVFDSSYERGQPAEFPVGGVIAGWVEALQLMGTGSKWRLHVPSELAYGAQGVGSIPPHSVLVFDVELLDIL